MPHLLLTAAVLLSLCCLLGLGDDAEAQAKMSAEEIKFRLEKAEKGAKDTANKKWLADYSVMLRIKEGWPLAAKTVMHLREHRPDVWPVAVEQYFNQIPEKDTPDSMVAELCAYLDAKAKAKRPVDIGYIQRAARFGSRAAAALPALELFAEYRSRNISEAAITAKFKIKAAK